jgi:hypothetical protein
MNRTINPTTTKQRRVGNIHHNVNILLRNIAQHDFDRQQSSIAG